MMEDYVVEEPLVAYKACLAEALQCLLTAEGLERSDSGELLASALRLHLRKQQAFTEYVQTSAQLVAVDIRDNDDDSGSSDSTTLDQADDEDSIRRRLLVQCFQGVNLHYPASAHHQHYHYHRPLPTGSPHSQLGPSL